LKRNPCCFSQKILMVLQFSASILVEYDHLPIAYEIAEIIKDSGAFCSKFKILI